MKIEQIRWTETHGWETWEPGELGSTAQLVIMFGSPSTCKKNQIFDALRNTYPNAHFFGCSTAGEISGTKVSDESIVVTAISFERSWFKGAKAAIEKMEDSFDVGRKLAGQFAHDDLVHVFVLSEGLNINGSELVEGLTTELPEGVSVTGGLAGDGDRFQETYVFWDGEPQKHQIAALGLYGKYLHVGYGSFGGWDSFGPERLISSS